jgi:hypothetical protein
VIGDGIFDQAPVYTAVENHSPGARVIIPPSRDAVLSPTATTAPTQRDQHVLAIENVGRCAWKQTSGYYAQSHAENAFSRFKRAFGGALRSKRDERQATGGLSGLRVAQSDVGTGSASVLCSQLKAGVKRPLHLLLDSYNNAPH